MTCLKRFRNTKVRKDRRGYFVRERVYCPRSGESRDGTYRYKGKCYYRLPIVCRKGHWAIKRAKR